MSQLRSKQIFDFNPSITWSGATSSEIPNSYDIKQQFLSYNSSEYLASRNGATITGGSITEVPTMTQLTLGSDSDNTLHWDDTIKLVSLWKEFKDQTTLNEMTT